MSRFDHPLPVIDRMNAEAIAAEIDAVLADPSYAGDRETLRSAMAIGRQLAKGHKHTSNQTLEWHILATTTTLLRWSRDTGSDRLLTVSLLRASLAQGSVSLSAWFVPEPVDPAGDKPSAAEWVCDQYTPLVSADVVAIAVAEGSTDPLKLGLVPATVLAASCCVDLQRMLRDMPRDCSHLPWARREAAALVRYLPVFTQHADPRDEDPASGRAIVDIAHLVERLGGRLPAIDYPLPLPLS